MDHRTITNLIDSHRQELEKIQQQLASSPDPIARIRSNSPHTTRGKPAFTGRTIDFQRLNRILSIDPAAKTAWIEPGVTMEALAQATLAHGLIPLVMPEFKGITAGGALMGAALESSSIRHGQFSDTCEQMELLLANGTRLEATPSHYRDLFYGVSGSYGSLASLGSLKIKLQPAQSFVQLTCRTIPITQLPEAIQRTTAPFVDGVLLDAQRALLMTGEWTSRSNQPLDLNRPWSKWFIQHLVEKKSPGWTCTIPVFDYLFRWDRAAFWMGQFTTSLWLRYVLRLRGTQQSIHQQLKKSPPTLSPGPLFRLMTGWKLSSAQLYRRLHAIPPEILSKTFHIQDFYIPIEKLSIFLGYLTHAVKIFPLWLCPLRSTSTPQFLSPHYAASPAPSEPHFVNVGVYGIPEENERIPAITGELEQLTHKLGGRKMLYAYNYYTEEQFWKIYDQPRYEELRTKYGAKGKLTGLYERVSTST